LRRGCAKTHDHFRFQRGDFRVEPEPAGFYLTGIRSFVDAAFSARLPLEVLHKVCQIHLFQINSSVLQRSPQEFAGWSDEGLPLLIFLIARYFPDHHDGRAG